MSVLFLFFKDTKYCEKHIFRMLVQSLIQGHTLLSKSWSLDVLKCWCKTYNLWLLTHSLTAVCG